MKSRTFGSDLDSLGALRMTPVKKYTAPGYPTYSDARGNPALLEKLPSRWQENAKVIACIGMLGAVALTGCDFSRRNENAPNGIVKIVSGDNHARVRIHGGGGGGAGYVVYLSEMEALSIIRAEAAAAGFTMSEKNYVQYRPFSREIEKNHKNAFSIWSEDPEKSAMSIRFTSSPLSKAFEENGADGVLWGDFLRLLKEHKETQEETPTP